MSPRSRSGPCRAPRRRRSALVEDQADHAGLEVTSQSRAVRPDDDPTREYAAAASAPEGRTRVVSEERSAAQGQHARVSARARDAQGRARNRSQAAARGTARLATHVLLVPLDARPARATSAETRRPSRPRHDAAVHAFESARDRSCDFDCRNCRLPPQSGATCGERPKLERRSVVLRKKVKCEPKFRQLEPAGALVPGR